MTENSLKAKKRNRDRRFNYFCKCVWFSVP